MSSVKTQLYTDCHCLEINAQVYNVRAESPECH